MSTLSLRVDEQLNENLSKLAEATGRSKSWLAKQAIEDYLAEQMWQIEEIKKGIAEADAGDFASPEEVERVFAKWR